MILIFKKKSFAFMRVMGNLNLLFTVLLYSVTIVNHRYIDQYSISLIDIMYFSFNLFLPIDKNWLYRV